MLSRLSVYVHQFITEMQRRQTNRAAQPRYKNCNEYNHTSSQDEDGLMGLPQWDPRAKSPSGSFLKSCLRVKTEQ